MGYDQADRLTYVGHKLFETGTLKKAYTHTINAYSPIGQLASKSLHGGLQTQTYKYLPRGWLCSQQTSTGLPFNQSLTYFDNGNVASQDLTSTTTAVGSATYSYDEANRLTGYTSAGVWTGYSESGIVYDKNGNLLHLDRSNGVTALNSLAYSYNGNQLTQVENSLTNTDPAKGFTNAAPQWRVRSAKMLLDL